LTVDIQFQADLCLGGRAIYTGGACTHVRMKTSIETEQTPSEKRRLIHEGFLREKLPKIGV